MEVLKKIKGFLDKLLLYVSLTLLAVMTIVIIYQVFSRQVLHSTPSWSEELSRVLFVWVAFLGVAYGFKEKLHIGVGLFVKLLPEKVQTFFEYFTKILIIGFGILILYYGWHFTTLMGNSTLPGMGVPSSVLYIVIPITGFYVMLYGIELLFVKGLYEEYDEDDVGSEG